MELIRGIELSCRKLSLVRKIIDFCNEEHITAIAEGVETKEEAEVLQGLGCPLFQGFFFGRPAALFDPKK
jgi:EAL domain-containing protein (putative c-di-GMP-specific phosphodiesterase class I)